MELRRMHPAVVRRWIVIRLFLLLPLVSLTVLLQPIRQHRWEPRPPNVDWVWSSVLLLQVAVLFLMRRTWRHPGLAAWRLLGRVRAWVGTVMLCAYPAGLMMGLHPTLLRLLMVCCAYGFALLYSWSRIRDAMRERIWEQERAPIAPVFD